MNAGQALPAAAAVGPVWEALVIGAGPAGTVAAWHLARSGLRTLLVERRSFPRDKVCGGCLNPWALRVLEEAGLGDVCGRLQAVPLERLCLRRAGQRAVVPLAGGMAVTRRSFDQALVAEAVSAGVTFCAETTAELLPLGEVPARDRCQQRGVRLLVQGQLVGVARSRVVLAADGLGHASLQRMPRFASRVEPTARIGLGTTVIDNPTGVPAGSVEMIVGRWGYVGVTHAEGGKFNVAAAIDRKLVQQVASPAEAVLTLLVEVGLPPTDVLRTATWHGTVGLTRHTPRLAEPGLFLLGDAAGYVEPFTGEGMAWALTAARAVVPLAREAAVGWQWRQAARWQADQYRLVTSRQMVCRGLAAVLRRRPTAALALAAAAWIPPLAQGLARRLHATPRGWETLTR